MIGLRYGGLLFLAIVSQLGWGQVSTPMLEQLKFTAVELLIYTDQLQQFEGTHCSSSVVSAYDVSASQQTLLAQLKPEHRLEFKQLFGSDQVTVLLTENAAGIEAMLGPQQLLAVDGKANPEQAAACQELGAVFQDNYLQTQQELQQLLQQYHR